MQPSVITRQIGIASDTISVDGQSRRKKNSTNTDSSVPSRPALLSSRSELVTLCCLVVQEIHADALQFGRLLDALDLIQHPRADVDQIRGAFAEDVETDRRMTVEAARVVEALGPQRDRGDVAEAQALRIERNRADVVEARPLPLRLHAETRAASADLSRGNREIRLLQALVEIVEIDVVRAQAIGRKLDLHLRFADTGQIHARDARNALERALDFAIEQVIRGRERLALVRRDAQLQDRIVRRREFLHGIALQIGSEDPRGSRRSSRAPARP